MRILSRGKRLNLAQYKISPSKPLKHRYKLYGAVKRGALKPINRGFLLRLGRSGKIYAFSRKGKGRWNIEGVHSPAVPQLIKNEDTIKYIAENAQSRFSERMNHEILRVLGAFRR